jgi:uncharacterized protein YjbI with pentapeptide repeats
MANSEHVDIFQQGVGAWNAWRKANPGVFPNLEDVEAKNGDLRGIDLRLATLTRMNLHFADLQQANLAGAYLVDAYLGYSQLQNADFSGANMTGCGLGWANLENAVLVGARLQSAHMEWARLAGAKLQNADLSWVNLDYAHAENVDFRGANFYHAICTNTDCSGADLREANFTRAELAGANFARAKLNGTNLTQASLVETKFDEADLTGSRVYGISAWNLQLNGTVQKDIIITPETQAMIRVDRLEVAQFIYLLLNNAEIRHVIDTVTSKAVLILGRFTAERMVILEALRDALRQRDYLPIIFDFEKPDARNLTETVSTLAHMARFVIADITDARSVPQELMAIVPQLPSVPVQPLLLSSQHEYGMFDDFQSYPSMLPLFLYEDSQQLIDSLEPKLLVDMEKKLSEITNSRS